MEEMQFPIILYYYDHSIYQPMDIKLVDTTIKETFLEV